MLYFKLKTAKKKKRFKRWQLTVQFPVEILQFFDGQQSATGLPTDATCVCVCVCVCVCSGGGGERGEASSDVGATQGGC